MSSGKKRAHFSALVVKGVTETSSDGPRLISLLLTVGAGDAPQQSHVRALHPLLPPNPFPHANAAACGTRSVVLAGHSTHLHLARACLGKPSGQGMSRHRATAADGRSTGSWESTSPACQRRAAQKRAARGVFSLLCRHEKHQLREQRACPYGFTVKLRIRAWIWPREAVTVTRTPVSALLFLDTYQSHPVPLSS